MIRTVMTLRMSNKDLLDTTFLVNDTQVGYLAPAGKRNQVFSSHRYVQLIAGFQADLSRPDAAVIQRENISSWQRCARDVQQRGLALLPRAAEHFKLEPDWLIGLDNKYLHAYLTDSFVVCLLRGGELFQVEPVADGYSKMPQTWLGRLRQSTVEVEENDYFLFLPPVIFEYVNTEEVQSLLGGMQQLSAKVNELVELSRRRGYELDVSWMALQIQRIEYDTAQSETFGEKITGFVGRFRRENPAETARQRAENSSLRNTAHRSEVDTSNMSEADLAAAAARASMNYRNQPVSEVDLNDDNIDDKPQPITSGRSIENKHRSVAAEARRRQAKKTGIISVWSGWRREQKWLAVLLSLSVLIIVAWGISTLVNGDDKTSSSSSTTSESTAEPTPVPPTTTTTAAPVELKLTVAVRSLNFRETPGTDGGLITTLGEGSTVTQIGEITDGWVQVRLEDGREAYAFAEYLKEVEPEETNLEE